MHKGKMMNNIFLFAALFTMSVTILAAPVELVKDGKAVAEIVTPPDANQSVKLASKDLQDYLKKISGAELKIVNSPTPDVKNQIYVGESEFTKKLGFTPARFNNSGFEIIAKDNYVILAGYDRLSKPDLSLLGKLQKWQELCGGEKFSYDTVYLHYLSYFNVPLGIYHTDDVGTWYAVSELLEQLGVRFYAPYEYGTVIPEKKDISVVEQNLKSEAAFARRHWEYYGAMREDKEGISWLKRLKCGNNTVILYGHSTYDVYKDKEQKELHPEYLAFDKDGKPISGWPPGIGMPRFGNTGFQRASAVYMNKVFDVWPEFSAITLGAPDGGITVDNRDINLFGKDGDSVEQRASDYFWAYNVFLAKELKNTHPGKFLLYMTGYGAAMVPTNLKSDDPDNIIITFLHPYSAYCVIKSNYDKATEGRKKWRDAVKQKIKSPIWDYYLYYFSPTHPRFPVFFTESLQEQMKEMQPYADGKFIELQPEWIAKGIKTKQGGPGQRIGEAAIIHLMMYWQNKLFWNPDADRKATLEEYYKLYFGPAAAEMKEFHEFAEAVWCRQESRSVTKTTGFLKEADVDRYFEILSRARAKAGKDTVYDKRIAAMEEGYQPLKKLFMNLQRKGPDVRAYFVPSNTKVDGDLAKYKNGWTTLRDKTTGELRQFNRTEVSVSLSEDRKNLFVAAVCYDNKMEKIKSETKLNDSPTIFEDDVIEVYINTPERSYFKIAVNPNGAIFDESTDVSIIERDSLPTLWNPGTKAFVKKYDDRWTVELLIPAADFGQLGPTQQYPWGIQIGRTRFAEGVETWALGTGLGRYDTLNQWGNLWTRK
jgi:hypothetical protein